MTTGACTRGSCNREEMPAMRRAETQRSRVSASCQPKLIAIRSRTSSTVA
jgi:hypothetical protein